MKRTDVSHLFVDIRDYEDADEAQKQVVALQEKVIEMIDHVESTFNSISNLLSSFDSDSLDKIASAQELATRVGSDLY